MYKNVLRSIEDVSLWPVVSILIFFLFFVVLLFFVWRMDKQKIMRFSNLPLHDHPKLATENQLPEKG